MKQKFYKASFIAEAVLVFLLVLVTVVVGRQETTGKAFSEIFLSLFSPSKNDAGNTTLYLLQLAPFFCLLVGTLFGFIAVKIISADKTPAETTVEKTALRYDNFWKFTFYANLFITVTLLLLSLVFGVVKELNSLFYYDNTFYYWMWLTTGILLVSCVTSALLLGTSVLWQSNRVVAVTLSALAILFFLSPVVTSGLCSVSILNDNQSNTDAYSFDSLTSGEGITPPEVVQAPTENDVDTLAYGWASELWSNRADGPDSVDAAAKYTLQNVIHIADDVTLSDMRFNTNINTLETTATKEVDDGWQSGTAKQQALQNFNKLVAFIGRDNDKISLFFDNYKAMLYSFVSPGMYFKSGIHTTVEGLLATYGELYDNETTDADLEKIYTTMDVSGPDKFWNANKFYDTLSPYFSKKVIALLSKDGDSEHDHKGNIVWAYSFWARRRKEGNEEAVYNILSEINSHYNDGDDEDDGE